MKEVLFVAFDITEVMDSALDAASPVPPSPDMT